MLNKIWLGDAYDLIKKIPGNSVDLIITDPPYEFNHKINSSDTFKISKRDYHQEYRDLLTKTGRTKETERLRIDATKRAAYNDLNGLVSGFDMSLLDELERVQKATNIYIWCSKAQIGKLLFYYEGKGCYIDVLAWHKTNPIPTCNGTYLNDTEYCIFARKKGVKVFGSYETKHKYYVTPANVEDKKKYKHPTVKPLNIISNFIINSSQEGDVVFDPFLGSGTTVVAAKKLGRNYIGFEINNTFYEIVERRLNE